METQETNTATSATTPYGETFRKGVTRVLDEINKLDFVTPTVKDKITNGAAKLCLAEALAEQKAEALAKVAKNEWETKYKKQVDEAAERLNVVARAQADALRAFFNARKTKE